jgi:SAM-dependent methyltransferase
MIERLRLRGFFNESEDKWNTLIDHAVSVIDLSAVAPLCRSAVLDSSAERFWSWLQQTELPFRSLPYPHKKALEFFMSLEILDLEGSDHHLDAAGGNSGFLDAVLRTSGCKNLYLSDQIYTGVYNDPRGIRIVGGDIGEIALPDASVTKISCHHAFEHLQADKDVMFIRQIGRLLRPGGRACIIPLILVDRYVECWNIDRQELFDRTAELIIDKTASIPGADADGHFARLYDLNAFRRRILKPAEEEHLVPTIITCRQEGKDLPDMDQNFGSRLNSPLRALVLDKPMQVGATDTAP